MTSSVNGTGIASLGAGRVMLSLAVPPGYSVAINKIAEELEMSTSALFRQAINQYVAAQADRIPSLEEELRLIQYVTDNTQARRSARYRRRPVVTD